MNPASKDVAGAVETIVPAKRAAETTAGYSHGPSAAGPTGFNYAVRHRRMVIAWTRTPQPARLLAWALSMRVMMKAIANQEFIDWWVSWLGELSTNESENEGRP